MPHNFIEDIQRIALDLVEAFGLTFEEEDQQLSDPLIRWLDFRLRYIDPRPRQTVEAVDFDSRIPPDSRPALEGLIAASEGGGDLNPFQTKTILRNDTSCTKRQLRTDALWADWGIHHAHLTTAPLAPGDEFSARSEWLLFFMVRENELGLIDVRSHSEPGIFQATDLVERAIRSWPDAFPPVEGVLGLAHPTATDPRSVKELRTAGVTSFLEVDGKVYLPPGMGMTTAATSTRASLKTSSVRTLVRQLGDLMLTPESTVAAHAAENGVKDPRLSIAVHPSGHLTVVCDDPQTHLPFPQSAPPEDIRSQISALLLPPWAGSRLVAHLQAAPSGT